MPELSWRTGCAPWCRVRTSRCCSICVPEHLDYYPTFDDYAAAKANMARFQSADDCYLIYNAEDAVASRIAASAPARRLR